MNLKKSILFFLTRRNHNSQRKAAIHNHRNIKLSIVSLLAAPLFLISSLSYAGVNTILVKQGETLSGGGSNVIESKTAVNHMVLKVSTDWPAKGTFETTESAYKILVRGTADQCQGAPVLEVSIDGEVHLTKTYFNKEWELGINNLDLPSGNHQISVRLQNPYHEEGGCRRAVYLDVIYLEKKPEDAPPATGNSPSGEPIPRDDIEGWEQIFADDFTQEVALGDFPDAVSNKWSAYPYPWRDTKGQKSEDPTVGGWYHPQKTVSIQNGVMDIWLHTEWLDHANKRLVAAPQPKIHGPGSSASVGQCYGRYAIRFRSDYIPGYKTAYLLWPDSETWPRDGEIDFPEGNLTEEIQGYLHWQNATRGDQQFYALTGISYQEWHTAVVEWEPDRVAFYLDGQLITNASNGLSEWLDKSKIPNTPMHWVLQSETRLDTIQPGIYDEGHIEIDWVSVWRKTGVTCP